MKLKIEKLSNGDFRFTLAPDTKAKPLVLQLTIDQLQAVLQVVSFAKTTNVFSFEMEL